MLYTYATIAGSIIVTLLALKLALKTGKKKVETRKDRQKKLRRHKPKKISTARTGHSYLVIGGTGMLGSHIVEALLARGETKITVFDRRDTKLFVDTPGVTFIEGDICDKAAVLEACKGKDTVICTAAILSYHSNLAWDWKFTYNVNVLGSHNVVDACIESKAKHLLYTSSNTVCAQYNGKDALYVTGDDESAPFAKEPFNCHYIQSKILGEQIALGGNGKNNLKVTVIRPSGMWGPRDQLLTEIFLDPEVKMVGHASTRQDFGYVENVVHTFLCAEAALLSGNPIPEGRAYNSGNGYATSYVEWNNQMARAFGVKASLLPAGVVDFLGFVSATLSWLLEHRFTNELRMLTASTAAIARSTLEFNCDRARRELKWEAPYTMEEAIAETADFYLSVK